MVYESPEHLLYTDITKARWRLKSPTIDCLFINLLIKEEVKPHIFIGLLWGASTTDSIYSWWRHQMETFSALLAIFAGNSPVPGEFRAQRPVTRSFDVFFDLRPKKRLSKQWWGWWFETPSSPLWRNCNVKRLKIADKHLIAMDTIPATGY